jgi:phosphatidylglycerol:prolipoprotein diacylglycerol transferase
VNDFPVHDFSPYVFGTPLRWYGVAYVAGFLAFYWGMVRFYRWQWSPLTPSQVSDLMMWVVVGVLAGGRLGYCLVYDWPQTVADPLGVIAFWRGGISGMSSHGGMVGAVLAILFYCRKHGISFWTTADHAAVWTPIGLGLGRVANFINGELWGRPSTVPWAWIFPESGSMVPRHPSQLYQALGEGVILFALLFMLRWRGWTGGRVAVVFLVGYGVVRFVVEFFREPDRQIGFLALGWSMGQWLSLGLVLVGGVLWMILSKKVWSKQG